MSLGVKSLWRAQAWSVCCIKELSLAPVPREQHHRQHNFFLPRRWMSTLPSSAPNSSDNRDGGGEGGQLGNNEANNEAKIDKNNNVREDEGFQGEAPTSLPSAERRAMIKETIKRKSKLKTAIRNPSTLALVKPLVIYSSKHETRRSWRKHVASADKQRLNELFSRAYDKPDDDWRSTLDFMLRHTPSEEEMFNLRVVIGKGAAQEARRVLSGLDTNIGQIERRNESVIKFEESFPDEETLVLHVSGTETAVRGSLRDIVKASGQVTAVRILDDDWKERLGDIWGGTGADQPLRLHSEGEAVAGDTIMTVQKDSASDIGRVAQPKRYQYYALTKRADDIAPPAEWTRLSFEKYVASLVYGVIPADLARQLYAGGLSHQETVVSLLVHTFILEHTQSAVSVSALKMALTYIHSKGPVFRAAARRIFAQAESLDLALDAEAFSIFLASASRAGEINNFNSILKLMVRKRFHIQSHAWYAFLEMIKHPKPKRYVIDKMQAQGLHRISSFRVGIGRQLVLVDLDETLKKSEACDISQFLYSHDFKYGKEWLDTITLNQMVDRLGNHGQLNVGRELLDLVYATNRTSPSSATLNTMITHSRKILDHIKLIQHMHARWPLIEPDSATYNLLFKIAWSQRLPNMLRVLFHYAVHDHLLGAKVRHRLTTLLQDDERNFSNRRFPLKAWEDAIFGKDELEATRQLHADDLSAHHVKERHIAQAEGMKLSVGIATKLQEAYELDLAIYGLVKEGKVLTSAMKESLTVDIPLRRKTEEVGSLAVATL